MNTELDATRHRLALALAMPEREQVIEFNARHYIEAKHFPRV